MPETLVDLLMQRPPTPDRPLLGIVVLVVEDSRFSCEALRLICHRSGARIRRAESLASAERHLRAYRPRVAIVDLGLPDGSGLDLIRNLARAEPRIEVLIAMSGDDSLAAAAMDAGADIFLPKPLSSVSAFQATVLGLLPAESRPPRVTAPADDDVTPDLIALRDDLVLAACLLSTDPDAATLAYLSGFLKSLARDTADGWLTELAEAVDRLCDGTGGTSTPRRLAGTIQSRIDALEAV